MPLDPKAIRKALMTAKSVASGIDTKFGKLQKAGGGAIGRMKRREEALHAGVPERMGTHIVKEKGGQWLSGSVEGETRGLHKWPHYTGHQSHSIVKKIDKPYTDSKGNKYEWGVFEHGNLLSGGFKSESDAHAERLRLRFKDPETHDTIIKNNLSTHAAVNDFVDKQLTRYIKNDMGTPHDPVRELAENDVTHFPDKDALSEHRIPERSGVARNRLRFGRPIEGVAKSSLAKGWEAVSDAELESHGAKDLLDNSDHEDVTGVIKNNPWIAKVAPETNIHGHYEPSMRRLGFDHLVDELHNSTAPGSDLPDHLQLRPESLARMSVPQAVQHVHNINEWRKDNKAKADAKRAFNPATYLHKDYPGEDYAWYELKSSPDVTPAVPAVYGPGPHEVTGAYPKKFDTEEEARNYVKEFPEQIRKANDRGQFDPILKQFERYPLTYIGQLKKIITPAIPAGEDKHLKDALKYEGDCMGHCVGGYHGDVAEGNSRIFSLRHKKTGAPHVTIETSPSQKKGPSDFYHDHGNQDLFDHLEKQIRSNGLHGYEFEDAVRASPQYQQYLKGPNHEEIVQIKGKGNSAPIDKYKPFVQDFVKSRHWSHVGDLQNSGLVQHPGTGEYMTPEERAQHPGYAAGGPVYDPKEGLGAVPYNQNVDYLGMHVPMTADKFLSLASPLHDPDQEKIDYMKEHIRSGKPLGNPFIQADWHEPSKSWHIKGHEGRHRVHAIKQLHGGDTEVPVHLFPLGMRARHLTDEMRAAPFVSQEGVKNISKNAERRELYKNVGMKHEPWMDLPEKNRGGTVNHEPTEAQKEAGNYKKQHVSFQGLDISIENKKGSTRSGIDANGKRWSCMLPADYGYIKRTEGADGDHVDVYLGPDRSSTHVFIINQLDHKTRKFDEHKCMLGYRSEREAIADYERAFSDGKGRDRVGSIESVSLDAFKRWLKSGKTIRPAHAGHIIDRAVGLADNKAVRKALMIAKGRV